MQGTNRNNEICFKSLEEAVAKDTKTYRHINLFAFGFPCQDISQANSKGKGLKGERSSIFFDCMRIANIFKPAWLLIENVPRLLSINEGRDFAVVLQTLAESGYGYSWRVLDSQYFGVAQRRKRVFIVGCLGKECPPEVLFEQKSSSRNDKKVNKMGQGGVCVSNTLTTRDGQKQDPTTETVVAQCLSSHDFAGSISAPGRTRNIVAQTIGATPRGNTSFVWQDTYIAETDAKREGKIAGVSSGLDSRRGIVIGNAVTVNVAEWIGKRILKLEGVMSIYKELKNKGFGYLNGSISFPEHNKKVSAILTNFAIEVGIKVDKSKYNKALCKAKKELGRVLSNDIQNNRGK